MEIVPPRAVGRAGRRRDVAGALLRGGGPPGLAKSGAPEVRLGCGLAVGHENGMRKLPVGLIGFGEIRNVELGGNGGSGRRGSPA